MLTNTISAQVKSLIRTCDTDLHGFEPKIKVSGEERQIHATDENASGLRTRPVLVLIRYVTTLVLLAEVISARAQSSVTLTWDAVTNSSIVGYRVYQGPTSRTYSITTDVGGALQTAITNLAPGSTNYFAVTSYDTNGLESDYSAEVEYVVDQKPPPAGLIFAATSGVVSSPFVSTNGIVYQSTQTTMSGSGRADYSFTIANAGPYIVFTSVNAPDDSANSLYLNIDAEPTDPMMIWDIPLTTGFQNRTASWRGEGGGQKIFNLQSGPHHLIVRGREANVQLSSVTISPAYPTLQITLFPGNLVMLNGLAQIGQNYEIQATEDLKTWKVLQTVTPDDTGAFALIDPNAGPYRARMYRLHGIGP